MVPPNMGPFEGGQIQPSNLRVFLTKEPRTDVPAVSNLPRDAIKPRFDGPARRQHGQLCIIHQLSHTKQAEYRDFLRLANELLKYLFRSHRAAK